MGFPVVHVEVIGTDPSRLRAFYATVFGWSFDLSAPVADEVSVPDDYGFVPPGDGGGAAAGVGGGTGFAPHALFYVGVPDVGAALEAAAGAGGTRVFGPARAPGRDLVVGQFRDPEGTLVGVAGPA